MDGESSAFSHCSHELTTVDPVVETEVHALINELLCLMSGFYCFGHIWPAAPSKQGQI